MIKRNITIQRVWHPQPIISQRTFPSLLKAITSSFPVQILTKHPSQIYSLHNSNFQTHNKFHPNKQHRYSSKMLCNSIFLHLKVLSQMTFKKVKRSQQFQATIDTNNLFSQSLNSHLPLQQRTISSIARSCKIILIFLNRISP